MKKTSKFKKLLKVIGPGFITGASDDDPSGIATYSQTGAQFGYRQLWAALFSYPFMVAIQEMCGRIGLVTGQGLAGVIKSNYSKKILYFSVLLLLVANTINIGADLGAMASSAQLLLGIPFAVWLIVMTIATLLLEIFVPYPTYAKFLKYLTFSLLAYIVVVFIVKQDWNAIAISTFLPSISWDKSYLLNIVAILGTTISPYLFFWQADEEVEEEIEHHKLEAIGVGTPKINKNDIKSMRLDTVVGMFFSNLVMFFIIATSASTLGANGILKIETADQAAQALRPLAGDFAYVLFALGIIGTGFLAVPILAGSASYALSESFNWKAGLSKKFRDAHGFYGVITLATLVGLLVNFTPIKPFQMLYYTAVLNGICAPPLIVIILLIANNKKIMGKYTNNKLSNFLGIAIAVIMGIAAIGMLYSMIF
jgi:NRAMP (natural resistance-associated macrophage protein)-like metal ion transporter